MQLIQNDFIYTFKRRKHTKKQTKPFELMYLKNIIYAFIKRNDWVKATFGF